jgi:hypothetical protein
MIIMAAANWIAGMANQYTKLAVFSSQAAKAGTIIWSFAVCNRPGYLPPIATEAKVGRAVLSLVASPTGSSPAVDRM